MDDARVFHEFQTHFPHLGPKGNAKFLERNRKFLGNIDDLLGCTFQKFWCYLVHEPRVARLLADFLHYHVRLHSIKYLDAASLVLYNDVYERVGFVYDRMLSCQESEVKVSTVFIHVQFNCFFFAVGILVNGSRRRSPNPTEDHHDEHHYHPLLHVHSHRSRPRRQSARVLFHAQRSRKVRERTKGFPGRNFIGKYILIGVPGVSRRVLQEFERIGAIVFNSEDPSGEAAQCLVEDSLDLDLVLEMASNLLDVASTLNSFASVCTEVVELGIEMEVPLQ